MMQILLDPSAQPRDALAFKPLGNWGRWIPSVHIALSHPNEIVAFPTWPLRRSGEFMDVLGEACGYWEACFYVMDSLLAWPSIARGLARWYNAGQPILDDRLRLLKEVWNSVGQLDLLAAWAWTHPDDARAMQKQIFDSATPPTGWLERFMQTPAEAHVPEGCPISPFHGGSNPLHLGHSRVSHAGSLREVTFLRDQKSRRATLTLDSVTDWRAALEGIPLRPATKGARSWRVDVFAREFGWLGEFRLSRETKRWFQGRHAAHALGR